MNVRNETFQKEIGIKVLNLKDVSTSSHINWVRLWYFFTEKNLRR